MKGEVTMHCLRVGLVPTSGLTFRILPGSIVHIATYPFVPPTTLSGYLRRLLALAEGILPPTTAGHGAKDSPPWWVLPRAFVTCGAYPRHDGYTIHRTARLGPESMSHTLAGRIRTEKDRENPQLHTWEYLITTELTGYVLHEDRATLDALRSRIGNAGCKLGKEGFAWVDEMKLVPLERRRREVVPSTIASAVDLLGHPADVFPLAAFAWDGEAGDEFDEDAPSPIIGYRPFIAGWAVKPVELDYWTDGGDVNIPAGLVEVLQ